METGKTGKGTGQAARVKEITKTGGDKKKKEVESTEEVGTSDKVGTSGDGNKVKKDRAKQKKKANIQT